MLTTRLLLRRYRFQDRLYACEFAVGTTTLLDTIVGTITSASEGKVTFVFGSTTLATTGVLEGEIEITDSASRTQTVVDLIKFKVRSQFG